MKDDNKILRFMYTFFLGLIIAIFVGIGVSTFYVAPEMPEWPTTLDTYGKEFTEEQRAIQKTYDDEMNTYNEEEMEPYNRNVSIITLSAAVLLLTLSMFLEKKKIPVIADGVMLGGLFTLMYSLGRGFASQDSKYSFIAVTIGLLVVLFLGYRRFVLTRPTNVAITDEEK